MLIDTHLPNDTCAYLQALRLFGFFVSVQSHFVQNQSTTRLGHARLCVQYFCFAFRRITL